MKYDPESFDLEIFFYKVSKKLKKKKKKKSRDESIRHYARH